VLRGLLDGVAFVRNPENKPQVVKSLAKGLRLERLDDAEEGYQSIVGIYEKKSIPVCETSSVSSALTTKKVFKKTSNNGPRLSRTEIPA